MKKSAATVTRRVVAPTQERAEVAEPPRATKRVTVSERRKAGKDTKDKVVKALKRLHPMD